MPKHDAYIHQENNSLNSINSKVILINKTVGFHLRKLGFVCRLASGLFKKTIGQRELAGLILLLHLEGIVRRLHFGI